MYQIAIGFCSLRTRGKLWAWGTVGWAVEGNEQLKGMIVKLLEKV